MPTAQLEQAEANVEENEWDDEEEEEAPVIPEPHKSKKNIFTAESKRKCHHWVLGEAEEEENIVQNWWSALEEEKAPWWI